MYQKSINHLGLIILSLVMFCSFATAQTVIKRRVVSGGGGATVIKELGAMITDGEGGFAVGMVLPADARLEAYQKLDIKSGDVVKMVNGKKFKSIADFQEFYDALEIGDEIQLGISRDKKMMILRFPKADPETIPQKMNVNTISADTENEFTILMDLGMIISVNDRQVQINQIIQESEDLTAGYRPEMGDVIKSVDGKPVHSYADLRAAYGSIKVGDSFKLICDHRGSEMTSTFTKPKPVKRTTKAKTIQ